MGELEDHDAVTARVIGADRGRRRIKLSMAIFDDRGLRRGSPVSGSVTGLSDDRVFVAVQGVPGFVRTEEWSGSTPIAGASFTGWVERVRRDRGELEISCLAFNRLGVRVGDTVEVTAVGAGEGRLVVTLPDGESAIVPLEELPPHMRADELARRQARLQAVIIRLDPAARGIIASVRRAITSYTFGDDEDDDVPAPNPFAAIRQKMRER